MAMHIILFKRVSLLASLVIRTRIFNKDTHLIKITYFPKSRKYISSDFIKNDLILLMFIQSPKVKDYIKDKIPLKHKETLENILVTIV